MRTSATKAGLCLCKLEKHGGVELYLNLTLECGERSDPCSSPFSLGRKSSWIRWMAGLVCPRACPEAAEKKKIIASAWNRTPIPWPFSLEPSNDTDWFPRTLSVNTKLHNCKNTLSGKKRNFFFLCWENGFSTKLPVVCKSGCWGSPGVQRPGCEVEHSPHSSAKINNGWIYSSTQTHIYLHDVDMKIFNFWRGKGVARVAFLRGFSFC
jgi:hypothetical protein